jgi:rhamnose transport system permease protein
MTSLDARTPPAASAMSNYGRPLWRRWLLTREGAVIVAVVLVWVVASSVVPK